MPRQTRQQIDDEIIDRTAALFARYGFEETSLQRVADAVGYSKSGLLRHFPSKDALQRAVVDRCLSALTGIVRDVADIGPGAERDHAVLTGLARMAIRWPGFMALLLWRLLQEPTASDVALLEPVGDAIVEAFLVGPDTGLDRAVRVVGAVGALTVARVSLSQYLSTDAAVGNLVAVGYDALGHTRSEGEN
ncbi:TetR/AcrR family transcriptional regulator [Umezawaea sp. NPDC059074]|uniref:TetR/AcrR family transcriptional regulator n=1 Tax=Umezawaea sp. NPDC059074 TaxID=3346716 RepID=UPI00369A51EC